MNEIISYHFKLSPYNRCSPTAKDPFIHTAEGRLNHSLLLLKNYLIQYVIHSKTKFAV